MNRSLIICAFLHLAGVIMLHIVLHMGHVFIAFTVLSPRFYV